MSIGENIRNLREKKNITQEELGESVGATQGMIAQLERGTRTLSLPLAVEMAKCLGCTLEELAG